MSTLSLRKIKHDSSAVDNIQLNSNGNTSVGTTNIAGVPLEVGGSVALGRISNTAYSRFLGIGGSGGTFINGTTGGGYVEFTNDTSYNNEIHLVTHWSGNQHARVVSVDYKGRVTMPYQPMCWVQLNGTTITGGDIFTTSSLNTNAGNCWNSSTHRFTAPVSGYYHCTAGLYTNYTSGYGYWGFIKNGSSMGTYHFNHGGYTIHEGMGATAILYCNTGDYIQMGRPASNGGGYFDRVDFSVFLLG